MPRSTQDYTLTGVNFRADFLRSQGGAHHENGGSGKVSSRSFHGCVARRLQFPRCRGNQLRSSSEWVRDLACCYAALVSDKHYGRYNDSKRSNCPRVIPTIASRWPISRFPSFSVCDACSKTSFGRELTSFTHNSRYRKTCQPPN